MDIYRSLSQIDEVSGLISRQTNRPLFLGSSHQPADEERCDKPHHKWPAPMD